MAIRRVINKVKSAFHKGSRIAKTEGATRLLKHSVKYVYYNRFPEKKKKKYKDILFINGCTLPHPTRFRVDHQIEQLVANGVTADSIFYDRLNIDMLKYYRGFVFFRCPVTDVVREFIKLAKESNKTCYFDIDDLVVDQKYTNTIKYVKSMSSEEKSLYDDGVNRMRETLRLCDFAITSTERLQKELSNYTGEVFVNRNVASDEMVYCSLEALDGLSADRRDGTKTVLGYFSGSITHNEDFEIILPAIRRLLDEHDNIYLKIVGLLDIPAGLEPFKSRIIPVDFMDWREMPKEMVSCDIILAPLKSSIFNEAKSENKWIEAGLVKVVTAASNIGAFKDVIKSEKTGLLIGGDDWYEPLERLINDRALRQKMAEAAHKEILEKHTTIHTGSGLVNFLTEKLSRNIAFVLPTTDISGGINVIFKHAEILRKRGWDVSLIDTIDKKSLKKAQKQYAYRLDISGYNVITECKTEIVAHFDTMVATLWSTLDYIKAYENTNNRLYFVQNYETDFYPWGSGKSRFLANATYSDQTDIKYVTMSLWCKSWLWDRFVKDSKYASNGIDLAFYPRHGRDFSGRIKILVEGDSKSEYKNTDEAFRIIEKLDPSKFEVSYLSYRKEPKDWYRVDHFYNRIPWENVGEIYAQCDILVKTSLLESFSYPPLEMMATGGLSVVVPNDGNVEYLRDGENCLFYEQGNIEDGVAKVKMLVEDKHLRGRLIEGGLKTAKDYEWSKREDDIVELYT